MSIGITENHKPDKWWRTFLDTRLLTAPTSVSFWSTSRAELSTSRPPSDCGRLDSRPLLMVYSVRPSFDSSVLVSLSHLCCSCRRWRWQQGGAPAGSLCYIHEHMLSSLMNFPTMPHFFTHLCEWRRSTTLLFRPGLASTGCWTTEMSSSAADEPHQSVPSLQVVSFLPECTCSSIYWNKIGSRNFSGGCFYETVQVLWWPLRSKRTLSSKQHIFSKGWCFLFLIWVREAQPTCFPCRPKRLQTHSGCDIIQPNDCSPPTPPPTDSQLLCVAALLQICGQGSGDKEKKKNPMTSLSEKHLEHFPQRKDEASHRCTRYPEENHWTPQWDQTGCTWWHHDVLLFRGENLKGNDLVLLLCWTGSNSEDRLLQSGRTVEQDQAPVDGSGSAP